MENRFEGWPCSGSSDEPCTLYGETIGECRDRSHGERVGKGEEGEDEEMRLTGTGGATKLAVIDLAEST